jgi:hypothetical protein
MNDKTIAQGQFWVGSNGNLFCDSSKFRYCIAKDDDGWRVARNGHPIGHELSLANAKLRVTRAIRDDF